MKPDDTGGWWLLVRMFFAFAAVIGFAASISESSVAGAVASVVLFFLLPAFDEVLTRLIHVRQAIEKQTKAIERQTMLQVKAPPPAVKRQPREPPKTVPLSADEQKIVAGLDAASGRRR